MDVEVDKVDWDVAFQDVSAQGWWVNGLVIEGCERGDTYLCIDKYLRGRGTRRKYYPQAGDKSRGTTKRR